MAFTNRTIAIAGASSGIGRGAAQALASEGATLSLADIQISALDTLAAELREKHKIKILACRVDVRDDASVVEWMERTRMELGKLDGAVNSVGVFRKGADGAPLWEKSDDEWDFVTDINLKGMFRCLRAEMRQMVGGKREEADGVAKVGVNGGTSDEKGNGKKHTKASIVNISSAMAFMGLPMDAPYCVSKHGIVALTRTAAKEAAALGLRVNCICPAAIDTPMVSGNTGRSREQLEKEIAGHTPMNRLGTVEEVAGTILWLLGEGSGFVTGACVNVDGGMTC